MPMKKTVLKDDNGKSLEVDLKEFLNHLNEYHKTGTTTHTQNGCSFTVETKKVIKYLNLNWENACLEPHKNMRSVKTASQQQVRRKVYTGSSEAWHKFSPFLKNIFDDLKYL